MLRSRTVTAALAIATLAAVTGCTAGGANGGGSPSADAYRVLVLGDSLSLDPPVECAGCTSFVSAFASQLSQTLGRPVDVTDDAVADTRIADVAGDLVRVKDDLASADLVLVWIGTNDGPPWPDDSPCGPVDTSTADALLVGVEAYSDDCISATVAGYRTQYADLFASIAQASPDADHAALTVYDNWFGHPLLAESGMDEDRIDRIVEKIAGSFDEWNVGLCSAAEASAFACVDAYRTLNGADGRSPAGSLLASDFTHLSQRGHDAIAVLLATAL